MRKMQRDPFNDIFNQMQKLFNEFQDVGKEFAPTNRGMPVDVQDTGDKIVVKADLPGVDKEDINLKADAEKVEISAQATHEVQEENEKYFRQERSSRSYRRSLMWPVEIDPETIEASHDDGVLTVEAEKTGESSSDIDIE